MIQILNLNLEVNSKLLLQDINLDFQNSKTVFLVGPNGSGKSTLCRLINNLKPEGSKVSGQILYQNQNLLDLETYKIAQLGFFLSWQNPPDLTGVTLASLSKALFKNLSSVEILKQLNLALDLVGLDKSYISRELDLSLSGGERKRLELVQLLLLKPKIVILDELDSGMDNLALKLISRIRNLPEFVDTFWLIVSHRLELIQSLKPDTVILLNQGKVLKLGGQEFGIDLIKQQDF
jgi:Fe-S cluster assembly ATP-binding protein